MTSGTIYVPISGTMAGFRRFSIDEYHRLIEIGLLTEDEPLELIEGYLVMKMPRNPPHDTAILKLNNRLIRATPSGWQVRGQSSATLGNSEPEPDFAVVRGDEDTYSSRHPGPGDIGLVIEVADSSLVGDRTDKGRIYASAGIPVYWIVNIPDRQIEVYSSPSGKTASPAYAQRQDYKANDVIPFVLDGTPIASFTVKELLP